MVIRVPSCDGIYRDVTGCSGTKPYNPRETKAGEPMSKDIEKTKRTRVSSKPPRTEAEARAQIDYLIRRDIKLLERLAKR
jgi:hypothetical protein